MLKFYDIAVVLNQPSMDKFEDRIKPGGILIYDSNGITRKTQRNDITICRIDATDKANEIGAQKTFNMIVLGGLLKIDPFLGIDKIMLSLKKSLPERHHHLLPANEEAMKIGGEIVVKEN